MKKTFKVVMLPTEKESDGAMWLNNNTIKPSLEICFNKLSNWVGQHLYIISDEQPKDGDWYMYRNESVCQASKQYNSSAMTASYNKKIVATTDELKFYSESTNPKRSKDVNRLPQLPELFIQNYIKDYNEGKPITVVDLEMEEKLHIGEKIDDSYPKEFIESLNKIKTRHDNTVIVHPSKMYSRNELESFIELAWACCSATKYKEGDDIGAY